MGENTYMEENKPKKPMLACEAKNPEKIAFPVMTSVKLDGVRATVQNGVVLSRSLKPIPNKHVQDLFGREEFEGMDGELIVGPANDPHVYNSTVSGVMSYDGEPEVCFVAFDLISDKPFVERLESLDARIEMIMEKRAAEMGRDREELEDWEVEFHTIGYCRANNLEDLLRQEELALKQGYEGLMIRAFDGEYKHGRSTEKQGYLMKLKQFKDIEAEIVGYKELMHNENEAKINELGYTERSTKKEGKVPAGVLGAFVCKAEGYAETFDVGTGFNAEQRKRFWEIRDSLIGNLAKIKIQPSGELNKPRFPVFLGFRDRRDLS